MTIIPIRDPYLVMKMIEKGKITQDEAVKYYNKAHKEKFGKYDFKVFEEDRLTFISLIEKYCGHEVLVEDKHRK